MDVVFWYLHCCLTTIPVAIAAVVAMRRICCADISKQKFTKLISDPTKTYLALIYCLVPEFYKEKRIKIQGETLVNSKSVLLFARSEDLKDYKVLLPFCSIVLNS